MLTNMRSPIVLMSILTLVACGSVVDDGSDSVTADDSRRDYGGATDYGEDTPPDRGPCAGECANDKLSACTCSSEDPCGWAADGVCESSLCVHFGFVAESYDDGSDCDGVEMPSRPTPAAGGTGGTDPSSGGSGAAAAGAGGS